MKLLRTMWHFRLPGAGLLVGLMGLAERIPSQSSVRMWGNHYFDTRSLELRCTKLAAVAHKTAMLRSDGRIFVQGQGGALTTDLDCVVPPAPPGLVYVDVALGWTTSFGLLNDGSLIGWGSERWPPYSGGVTVPPLPGGMRYTRMVAGAAHVILERSDGSFITRCTTGSSDHGQGNLPSIPPGLVVTDLQAVELNSAFLLSDGTLLVWGYNLHGQCNVPTPPIGLFYTAMALSGKHTLALRSDGMIVSFGDNFYGQCNVPALPAGTSYVRCTAGGGHSVALRSDGVLVAWGDNFVGQCNVPSLPLGVTCEQLVSGNYHTAARLSDGSVLTWGFQSFFESGLPSLPRQSGNPPKVRHVDASVGEHHAAFVLTDGSVQAFGKNTWGQCNVPPLPAGLRYLRAHACYSHSAALRSDGQVVAWGDNSGGQCTVPPLPTGTSYIDLAIGIGHTVALRSDGQALAFGYNTYSQCNIPPPPPGLGYVAVDAGEVSTLLLRSDGAIVLAGYAQTPPALPPGVTYVDVAVSACLAALRSDGVVVTWGGASGTGSFWVPVPPLPFGVYYVEAEGGGGPIVLRRSDGQVVVCGYVGGYLSYLTMVPPLDPGTSFVQVSASLGNIGARVGPTCTYASFASGCAGSLPATRLVPRDTPRIGKTHQVTLFDLPMNTAIMVMGWQRFPAPIALDFLGMPGCAIHTSLDGTALLAGQGGQVKWFLPIPNQPSLVGLHFYNQALVFDPGANPFGAVFSDAAEGVIGHW